MFPSLIAPVTFRSIGVRWFQTKLRQLVGLGSSFLAVFGILCCPVYASFDSSWIGQTYDLTSGLSIEDPRPAPAEDTENFYSSRRLLSSGPFVSASSSPSGSSSDLTLDLDFSSAVVSSSASNTLQYCFASGGVATFLSDNSSIVIPAFRTYNVFSDTVSNSIVSQSESGGYVFGWRSSAVVPPDLVEAVPSGVHVSDVSIGSSPTIANFDVSIPVHFSSPVYGVSLSFAGTYPSYRFLSESNNFLNRVSAFGSFFFVEVNGSTLYEGRFGSESVLSFSSPVQDLTIRFFSPGLTNKFSVSDSCPWWAGWESGNSFDDCFNAGTYWYQYLMEIPHDFRFIVSGTDGFAAGDQQMIVNDNISSSASDFASSEDSFVNAADSSIDSALPSDFGTSLDSDATAALSAVSTSFSSFWDTLPSGFVSYFLAFMTVGLAAFILRRVG